MFIIIIHLLSDKIYITISIYNLTRVLESKIKSIDSTCLVSEFLICPIK